MTVFSFFKSHIRLLKFPLIYGTIWVLIADFCGRLSSYFASRLINLISMDIQDKSSVLGVAVSLICLYALFSICRSVFIEIPALIDKKYIPYIRGKITKDLFLYIHKHPSSFFEQEMSGNIATKVRNVVYGFEYIYSMFIWALFQPVLTVITVIICVMIVNFTIGFILLFMMLIFYKWVWDSSKAVMPLNKEYATQSALSVGRIVDSISNADTVKSFSRQFYEEKYLFRQLNKTSKCQRKLLQKTRWVGLKQGTGRNVFQFVLCIIPLIYWYMGALSFADYIFIQGLVITVSYQTGNFSMDLTNMLSAVAVFQEGLDVIYQPILLTEKENATPLKIKKGHIKLKNISFSYIKRNPVFKNFILDIKPKERIGFVGYSGCGKSTLIKLINRTYDVSKGAILIDGQNLKNVTLKSLHQAIGYIPQEPCLLNRTIRENILYAKPNATEAEMVAAAKKAYCHEFIMNLPNGYDSKVGDKGVMLSGGERQRIAIARAILKDAPILILDEATSALDATSEFYIQKSLENLMKGKTVIAIAHRLSTLKQMTRLIVLEKGKIVEDGAHAHLMKNKKLYYQFYKMQSTTFIGE